MDIDNLTIGELKELQKLLGGVNAPQKSHNLDDEFINEYCIIRTYSAGVWFGKVIKKCQDEVILTEARRLYYWKTIDKGISLSEVATSGLHSDSKVCIALVKQWLKAIEIILCEDAAIKNIQGKENYVA